MIIKEYYNYWYIIKLICIVLWVIVGEGDYFLVIVRRIFVIFLIVLLWELYVYDVVMYMYMCVKSVGFCGIRINFNYRGSLGYSFNVCCFNV